MNINLPLFRFVFDRRKKATPHTASSVELEINFGHRQRRRLSTGVKLYAGQWDDKLHAVNHPDGILINASLIEFQKYHEQIFYDMYAHGLSFSLDDYDLFTKGENKVKKKVENNVPCSFLDFMKDRINERNLRASTKATQMIAHEALCRFGKINTFESLTPANIKAFDIFLRNENPNRGQACIHNYHKRIKVYVKEAYELEYIEKNPYEHFKDVRGRHKPRKPLSSDELKSLQELPLSGKLDRIRDLFVFCCYTGLAYCDMNIFNYHRHVIVAENGMQFIDGERIKTGTNFFTPLLKPAIDILEKYDFKLPSISDQKYNDYLHVIEAKLGFNKPLTSHIARHTFATTVCLMNDIPIETLSRMLGHRHVSTTEIYAKVMNTSVKKHAQQLNNIL